MSWAATGLVLIIIIILICAAIWAYRRKEKIIFFSRDARTKRKKVVSVEYDHKHEKVTMPETFGDSEPEIA